MKILFILFILSNYSLPVFGEPQVQKLLKSTNSWDGGAFYYPSGKAEISILKVHLEKEEIISFHCHLVPTAGYILKGEIEVTLHSGESKIFTEGQAILEVMKVLHTGKAVNGNAEILVFHAGAINIANTDSGKNCSNF